MLSEDFLRGVDEQFDCPQCGQSTSLARVAPELAYEENDRPVYKIVVSTTGRDAAFATFLSPEEKDWIVARINQHLQSPAS